MDADEDPEKLAPSSPDDDTPDNEDTKHDEDNKHDEEEAKVDTTDATATGSDEGEGKNDNETPAAAAKMGSTVAEETKDAADEETKDDADEETKDDGGVADAVTGDATKGDTASGDAIKGDGAADTSTEKAIEETTASNKEGEAGADTGEVKTKRRKKKASADDDSDEYVDEEDFDTDSGGEDDDVHPVAGAKEVFAPAAAAPSTPAPSARRARKSTPNYQEAVTDDEVDDDDDYNPDVGETTATPGTYQPKRRRGRPRRELVYGPSKASAVLDTNISEVTGPADFAAITATPRPSIITSPLSVASPPFGGSDSVKKKRRGRPSNAERLAAGGLEMEGKKKRRPRRKLKPGSKVELIEELVLVEGDGGSKTMTVKPVAPPKKRRRRSSAVKSEGNGEVLGAEAIGEDGAPVKKKRGPGRPRKDPSLVGQTPKPGRKKKEEGEDGEPKKKRRRKSIDNDDGELSFSATLTNTVVWERNFKHLIEYFYDHGDTRVPLSHPNKDLVKFVRAIRRSYRHLPQKVRNEGAALTPSTPPPRPVKQIVAVPAGDGTASTSAATDDEKVSTTAAGDSDKAAVDKDNNDDTKPNDEEKESTDGKKSDEKGDESKGDKNDVEDVEMDTDEGKTAGTDADGSDMMMVDDKTTKKPTSDEDGNGHGEIEKKGENDSDEATTGAKDAAATITQNEEGKTIKENTGNDNNMATASTVKEDSRDTDAANSNATKTYPTLAAVAAETAAVAPTDAGGNSKSEGKDNEAAAPVSSGGDILLGGTQTVALLDSERIGRINSLGFDWKGDVFDSWDALVEQLVEYKKANGHCKVPSRKRGTLSLLSSFVQTARRRYHRLKKYAKQNGEPFPFPDSAGATAGGDQQEQDEEAQHDADMHEMENKSDKEKIESIQKLLTPERIKQLMDLDFDWDSRTIAPDQWERRYQQVVEFQKQHGHLHIPKSSYLSKWCSFQRRGYRHAMEKLKWEEEHGKQQDPPTEEKKEGGGGKDEETKVASSETTLKAEEATAPASAGKATGDLTPDPEGTTAMNATDNDETKEGKEDETMKSEGEGTRTTTTEVADDNADATTTDKAAPSADDKKKDETEKSKEEDSNGAAPAYDMYHTAGPDKRQYKKYILAPERIEKLNAIGFPWEGQAAERLATWEKRYLQLVEYKKEHGDCRVPKVFPTDPALGMWCHAQRMNWSKQHRGKPGGGGLTAEKIRKLEEIGFDWQPKQQQGGSMTTTTATSFDSKMGNNDLPQRQYGGTVDEAKVTPPLRTVQGEMMIDTTGDAAAAAVAAAAAAAASLSALSTTTTTTTNDESGKMNQETVAAASQDGNSTTHETETENMALV